MLVRNVIVLYCIVFSACYVFAKDKKESDKKEKDKEKKRKSDKEDKKEDKSSAKNTSTEEDDYDTTQGYPILYPETHMMSQLKRNVTSQPNVTSSYPGEVEDDEMFAANFTKTSQALEEAGKCTKSVDLLFVLDSSESVKYSNWKIIIEFVKNLANRFTINATRVGIIRYASEAEVALPLTLFNSTEARDNAIDDIFYKTGGTRTDIALKKASEVFHIEDQRSQVMMLVTDGPTNRLEINKDHFVEGKDLVAGPAYKLKQAGVAIFCIGVEPDSETPEEVETMKDEMRVIASEPTRQHLFLSDGYHELERKVEYVSKAACVVNGGWSTWSEYSPCSVTCGFGTKVRMRTCSNPSPENNGADCTGTRVETEECDLGTCNVVEPSFTRPPTDSKVVVKSNDTSLVVNSNTTLHDVVNNTAAHITHSVGEKNDTKIIEKNETKISEPKVSDVKVSEVKSPPKGVIGGCYEGLEELKLNDSQYNASSVYSHDTDDEYVKREYAAPNAKLNNEINGGGWCAEHKFAVAGDKNQYLQFDLGKQMTVDAVATQGSHLLENWVTSYNLRYSDDAMSWEYYAQNPLEGNKDRAGVRKHILVPPVVARYIQLNPIEWNEQDGLEKHDICMRAALFKCKDGVTSNEAKRGITRSQVEHATRHHLSTLPRGVILKEAPVTWSHYPKQNTRITVLNYDIEKRQHFPKVHHKVLAHKRILSKVRKVAHHIMRKMRRPSMRGFF